MHVQSLGQEDPLEKQMATCSNIFAWEIPWTEEPGGLLFTGSQKNQTQLSVSMYMSCIFTKHSLGICQKLVGSRFLISLCLADVPAWFQTAVKICSYPEINLDADLCIFVSTKRV